MEWMSQVDNLTTGGKARKTIASIMDNYPEKMKEVATTLRERCETLLKLDQVENSEPVKAIAAAEDASSAVDPPVLADAEPASLQKKEKRNATGEHNEKEDEAPCKRQKITGGRGRGCGQKTAKAKARG